MSRTRIEDTIPEVDPYKLFIPPYLLTTYPVVRRPRSGRSFRFYPENVKGRPLFPKHGYSRMCS